MKTNTFYAMNKADKDAIVYVDAFGTITRLTRDDFASEEEFRKWKGYSDEDYHEQEKADHVERNHTISIEEIPEGLLATESAEDTFFSEIERRKREKTKNELLDLLRRNMTETQFRRLHKYYGENMTLKEIEGTESADLRRISKSIHAGKAHAKKILKNISDNDSKQGEKRA